MNGGDLAVYIRLDVEADLIHYLKKKLMNGDIMIHKYPEEQNRILPKMVTPEQNTFSKCC